MHPSVRLPRPEKGPEPYREPLDGKPFTSLDPDKLGATFEYLAENPGAAQNGRFIQQACIRGDILSLPDHILEKLPDIASAAVTTLTSRELGPEWKRGFESFPRPFKNALISMDPEAAPAACRKFLQFGGLQKLSPEDAERWVNQRVEATPEFVIREALNGAIMSGKSLTAETLFYGINSELQQKHYQLVVASLQAAIQGMESTLTNDAMTAERRAHVRATTQELRRTMIDLAKRRIDSAKQVQNTTRGR